jgi:hypothetical protein
VLSSINKDEGFWLNAKSQFVYDPSIATSVGNVTPVATLDLLKRLHLVLR